MRTVTLVAYNRPNYVAQVISSLAEALLKPDENLFNKLIFSVDPGNAEVVSVCERAAEVLSESGLIDCLVYVNKQRFGLTGNTLLALQRAFDEHDSDFNVAIEDDACLTTDAMLLANWYYDCNGGPLSEYTLMSMCNHRDFGRGTNPGNIPNDPSLMAESLHISSPFAWCTTKWQWPFIKSTWDMKEEPPNGWDWSLTLAIRLARRRTLHPILSRCKNIGRESGEHESPETFDGTQTNIVYSDGEYLGPYKVAARIGDESLMSVAKWVAEEKERMLKKR